MIDVKNSNIGNDSIRMTKKAQDSDKRSHTLAEQIFSGESDIKPTDVFDQAAGMINPNISFQNLILFTEANKRNFPEADTCIMISYPAAEEHFGRTVKEGEKGSSAISGVINAKDNTVKYRGSSVFNLSQTYGEELPRLLPDFMEAIYSSKHDDAWDKINELRGHNNPDYLTEQISEYVFYKHFQPVMDEHTKNEFQFDVNEMNELITDKLKNKNWNEISQIITNAIHEASEEIDILTDSLESEIENAECYHEGKLFGSYVLCSFDKGMRTDDENNKVPIDMYAYEVYAKGGHEYVAKHTPEDGKFSAYIVTAHAISDTDGPGLRIGPEYTELHSNKIVSVADFRKEHANTPIAEMDFFEKDAAARNNPGLIIREPCKHLRIYGVFSDGQLISGGYLSKGEVPHTDEELLNFQNEHDPNHRGKTIILNCDGELSGIEVEVDVQNTGQSRKTTVLDTILEPEEVRDFVVSLGGNPEWAIRENLDERESERISDDMPKEKILAGRISDLKKLTHDSYGANPYGSQILSR